MKAIPCNEEWFCRHSRTDEPPIPVRIPDDAMPREPRGARSSGGANVGWFDGRDYSYTKTLTLSEQDLSGALLLEFEGVYRKAEVFVNGKKAGARPYGYFNFYVDLIPFAKIGETRIEVRAFSECQGDGSPDNLCFQYDAKRTVPLTPCSHKQQFSNYLMNKIR